MNVADDSTSAVHQGGKATFRDSCHRLRVEPPVSEDNQGLVTVQLVYDCLNSLPCLALPISDLCRVVLMTSRFVGVLFLSWIVLRGLRFVGVLFLSWTVLRDPRFVGVFF